MTSLHVDCENQNATSRIQNAQGAKYAATAGVAAASRVTQRKPLGVVNRVDGKPQGSATEAAKAKKLLPSTDRALIGPAKLQSYSQPSHRPRPQLQQKAKLKAKVVPAAKEQKVKVNAETDVKHEVSAQASCCSKADHDDYDSDTERMFPAPDEDDFSNYFPASQMSLVSQMKRWQPPICRPTQLTSRPISLPNADFATVDFAELEGDLMQTPLPAVPEITDDPSPPPLYDEQDLEYFSMLH